MKSRYVYNKEMVVENREPYCLDLHPEDNEMSYFAIYYDNKGYTDEWHVKASSMEEALGAFFMENRNAMYCNIIDHMELA